MNHCYDAIESGKEHVFVRNLIKYLALFTEELTKIAQDEIFNEFALKLQARFLSHWVDHEMIPEIVRECRNELLSHQEEELNRRDRIAIESLRLLITFFLE